MSSSPNGFIPPHGGYQNLMSYQMAEIVYDAHCLFCNKYINKFQEPHDQMVQAAKVENKILQKAAYIEALLKAEKINRRPAAA